MNQIKRIAKMLSIVLILSMAVQLALPGFFTSTATAATIAISPKKLTLEVGKTKVLKVTGTKVKATWKSSDAKIATVSKTGLVTAKKAGKATITATVNKKAYICNVTVKEKKANNPLVDAAPFKAQADTFGDLSYIYPTTWNKLESTKNGVKVLSLYPTPADGSEAKSSIELSMNDLSSAPDFDTLSQVYSAITKETLISQFAQLGMDVTIENYAMSTYDKGSLKGFVVSYRLTYSGVSMNQAIYDIYTSKHLFEAVVTDATTDSTELNQVVDYLLSTAQISE